MVEGAATAVRLEEVVEELEATETRAVVAEERAEEAAAEVRAAGRQAAVWEAEVRRLRAAAAVLAAGVINVEDSAVDTTLAEEAE